MTKHPGTIHIIAQGEWHDNAFIIGTKTALAELRDAINKALAEPDTSFVAVGMTDDGEGYWNVVQCVENEKMGEVPLGYTVDYAQDDRPMPDWVCNGIISASKETKQ